MRIVHLDTETGFRGGERQVQLLVEGLRRRGVESLVIGPRGGRLLEVLAGEGIATADYGRPGLMGMHGPVLRARVRRMAREFGAGIVHAHTGRAHTLAVGCFLGRMPVVTTRRVDFAVKDNFLSRRKYTAPGQRFIAISRGVRDVLLAGGVDPGVITVVPSGVEVQRVVGGDGAALRREWLAGADGPLIGFVGALVDHKAPWLLAEALPLIQRQLPGAVVVFVGEGAERPRLEALARQHPGIVLAGWRTDMADCYAALDMFVMPSKLEGLCTALVDALAAGVPAVATAVGGMPDVVVDGETGLLAPAGDTAGLAECITRLWRDGALRGRCVANGRDHVARHFTADAMVEGTLAVYRSMARGGED